MLYQGIIPSGDNIIAEPWDLQALASSPLSPEGEIPAGHIWRLGGKNGVTWLEYPAPGLPAPLYITGPCTSTLDVARELGVRDCFPVWSSVLSLKQTAGRGQMRRNWVSPEGNLYSALRLPLKGPFRTFAAAPAIGALLAEGLNRLGFSVALKWPNDLMDIPLPLPPGMIPRKHDGRKVGGILLEQRGDALVAGTGINIASCPPEENLRDNFAFCAGTLLVHKQGPGYEIESKKCYNFKMIGNIFTLWLRLAAEVFSCYEKGTSPDTWWPSLAQRHLAFRGCRVVLSDAISENDTMSRTPCEGIIDSITPSGALVLKTEHGSESFLGGSLLPAGRELLSTRR